MIDLIFQSYFTIFISVGVGCLVLFILGLFWIFKKDQSLIDASAENLSVIAGDDLFTTQLDLARAYIESNRKALAKTILDMIAAKGNTEQKKEAKVLLGLL